MKGLKQIGVMAIAALTALQGTAFAEAVAIKDISVSGGKVTVEAVNHEETEKILSVSVVKQQAGLHRNLATRTVRQQLVAPGETLTVTFTIPDEKNGVDGSGTYLVKVHNEDGGKTQQSFDYADSGDVTSFIGAFKGEAAKVTESLTADVLLLPLLTATENKGVLFCLGVDRATFMSKSENIRKDTANLMYQAGVSDMDTSNFASTMLTAFGLASFNNEEEIQGIAIMQPTYAGKAADEALIGETVSLMAERYESTNAFETGFKKAYGLTLVNHADTSTVGDALKGFRDETGLCTGEIDNVLGLSPTQQYEAYRSIVNHIATNKPKTETNLATILTNAYNGVINAGQNQGGGGFSGGGGGGGAAGTAGNKDKPETGSVSVAQGSGVTDTKPQHTAIFTDLLSNHWAAEGVKALKEKGIISGTDTGAFEPDRAVTREEFTKMIVLASDFALEGAADFTDAATDGWYLPYLGTAVEKGIVGGLGDGRFGIGMNISRQDMAVMVKRALDAKGITWKKVREYQSFGDETEIAAYAKDAVKTLFEAGIINGKGAGAFDPMGQATRAEAAKIIYEACKEV